MSTQGVKAEKKGRSKSTKIVILKLPSSLLSQFAPAPVVDNEPSVKPDPDADATQIPSSPPNSIPQANGTSADATSESASTPAPTNGTQHDDPSIKRSPSVKDGGTKRPNGDSTPKPRGKPGPKRRKLDDGTEAPVRTSMTGAGALPKLGPRANQGAINAGLRALDRTGKPCRKWERKSFQLKSFTGVAWELPSWRAPPKKVNANDDPVGSSGTNESESKPNESSTGQQSERSNPGDRAESVLLNGNHGVNGTDAPAASSPPPAPLAVAVES